MGRPKRVLSFMSQWGGSGNPQTPKNPPSATASPGPSSPSPSPSTKRFAESASFSHSATALDTYNSERASPSSAPLGRSDSRLSLRPMSMIQTYQPPIMEVSHDTLPELQRVFMFLNSHSNKLYQEGYFLKFHDTDARGRPAPDRKWQEYFVQLVGTILSLWDASALDTAGGDVEVVPTFINLTDAAIHMIPTMTLKDGKRLDNILSVSTAASNKYLFHFDSYHALTQWTAGIRLAIYEHTTLQEAYTGALIAGKGKMLNNIRTILDRQCTRYEDWVRVRFGAGTPWRRCWCVVNPPDQKEYARLQKMQKKANAYDRSQVVMKGDIKFYDTKKITKKTRPIATVTDAYSCYALYPQSKPLIDQSTLVKIEARITIHSKPATTTEGFVFVMPETRPAVSGFEIMLQYLFPVFDTFNLYGRPKKLIADVLDTKGLMFAMPPDRRYGYLEIWDIVGLINTQDSSNWTERQWRKQLKDLTSTRMMAGPEHNPNSSRGARRNTVSRSGVTPSRQTLRFENHGSVRSQPSTRQASPIREADAEPQMPQRVSTLPTAGSFASRRHQRSVSEHMVDHNNLQTTPSHTAYGQNEEAYNTPPPPPPPHGTYNGSPQTEATQHDAASDSDEAPSPEPQDLPEMPIAPSEPPQGPIDSPPMFAHSAYQEPPVRPSVPPMMKPNPQVDSATLHQMADATNAPLMAGTAVLGASAAWKSQESLHSRRNGDTGADAQQIYLSANARYPPTDRQSADRLPTIPASPYVEHTEFVDSPMGYRPNAPPVPEHSEMPSTQFNQRLTYRPHSGSGGGQIQRKPLPGPSPQPSQEDDTRSTSSSIHGSLRNEVIDPDALDALNQTNTSLFRPPSASSSRYDDDAVSTSTPDYASVASEEAVPAPRKLPERQVDRPRSGIMTTIGDPSLAPKSDVTLGDDHRVSDATQTQISSHLPSIDFGPTYVLDLDNNKRPGTSGTMSQTIHDDSSSRSRENFAPSLNEQHRLSFTPGRSTPNTALHMRSNSGSQQISESRTVAWQPAMVIQQQPDRPKFDAEEWVAHRAAHQPQHVMYSHGRSKSHTPPPMNRARSGDWAHLQRTPEGSPLPGRPTHRPVMSNRPQSRGAELLLDSRPTSLSAREQEHVARMTNTPLIDLAKNAAQKQQEPSQGLTAFIDLREKEKAAFKAKNRQSSAVQAEIERRMLQTQERQFKEAQQHQRQMMEAQQINQQMAMAQSTYAPSMMGTPSVMGLSGAMTPNTMGPPSVMGMSQSFGTPTGGIPSMAYTAPGSMQQTYPQQGYFHQQVVSPGIQMPGGWAPGPQPMPSPQLAQQMQQSMPQQMSMGQQSQRPTSQAYGASFDQAQASRHGQHRWM